jgi:lambda family phage portal protein
MSRIKRPNVQPNLLDKVITYFDPVNGARRYQARTALAMTGGYHAGKKNRRQTSSWKTTHYDADGDILPDLGVIRERSRDLERNAPLAAGALKTKKTNVVGTGLKLQADPDWQFLGMDEAAADKWKKDVEREFALWGKAECDAERTLSFYGLQGMAFYNTLVNGDLFVSLPFINRPGSPYDLKIQLIEADRVCNEKFKADTASMAGGVEKDEHGAPLYYHVMKQHPGSIARAKMEWIKLPAFGEKTGRRNVLHLYQKLRPGQSRGVPDLAPVIEAFKQLTDYSEAECMAALVSSMFTVFITSNSEGGVLAMDPTSEIGGKSTDKDFKMGPAAMLELMPDEKVEFANPSRPNAMYEPFVNAILQQIGVALELPFEVLTKHFTSSYSAARAALIEAWKFFLSQRAWLAEVLCQPIYEAWMTEAVALGRIYAPGYLNGDPSIREAYHRAQWIGPARGQIDEFKEIKAARISVDMGVKTLEEVTNELTGGSWESKHHQRAKEVKMRRRDGLEAEMAPEENGQAEQGDIPNDGPET